MRLIAALIVVALALLASPARGADCGTIVGWVGVPLCQAAAVGDVEVPNVVGEADFAAADAILEGVGLDGTELSAACSAAALGVIVGQNPDAGTEVPLATVVGVVPSSGMACPASDGLANPAGLSMGFGFGF